MHPSIIFATLVLSAGFVSAQCPSNFTLIPNAGKCVCQNGNNNNNTVPPNKNCVYTVSPNNTACYSICPSPAPSPWPVPSPSSSRVKRQQLIMNEDGTIANCPGRTISCPIHATMNMGYECISPQEDLDNCGGCVSLGQGVSCEKVAGVKKTECSRGRCVIHTCRSGWALDRRSNTCIPRPRRDVY